jgi:ABC-type uncharacterized transport system substrate-binding protein
MIARMLLVALGNLAVAATPAIAHSRDQVPSVGILAVAASVDDPLIEALRQGLRERGYVEGQNVKIEFRTAQGNTDRLPVLARELVQKNVDVIVVGAGIAVQAIQRVTYTTPIVLTSIDIVASRLAPNLAHPTGQVTGLSNVTSELYAKRLQLLKDTVPRLSRVAVLQSSTASLAETDKKLTEELRAVAPSMSVELRFVQINLEDPDATLKAISQARVQGLYVAEHAVFYVQRTKLVNLISKTKLPAVFGTRAFTEEGGLLSYGVNYLPQWHRAAEYVDKILKGSKPSDLPIEQATIFELVVNLKTAKALGLKIPEAILLSADEVIR